MVLSTLWRDDAPESLQTKFSSFSKHQNRLGRLLTMGIPRPSLNILIQEVGVGPWEKNGKQAPTACPTWWFKDTLQGCRARAWQRASRKTAQGRGPRASPLHVSTMSGSFQCPGPATGCSTSWWITNQSRMDSTLLQESWMSSKLRQRLQMSASRV